ncbi:endonuclease/exonuclease/phosphatase family protein [Noviherbaspirillum aerium]|uniref:endonuclease/exonuclease/phosphatase family protein n=1 Tax=Noviherbaspirillum aerium TaxID=2588497 RepID=UPI00124E546F|nr:endonuclease/exonuclease/phosphatase family protein [Noviherbaspirillum aerium]
MSFAVILSLTVLLVLATLLPLSRSTHWWIRDLDFPRLQIAAVGATLLVAELFFLDLKAVGHDIIIAATLACMLYQAWWIFPYTRPYPNEVKLCADGASQDDRLRILASNVLGSNRNAAGLIAMIREHQPDIFVTLESTAWWQSQLDMLETEYPYTIKCPLENLYGMHVYSRLPLKNSTTRFLVEPDIPSMHTTVVLRSGQTVQVHFLHPTPPSPTENDESAARDAELMIVAKQVANLECPVIVAGDLNDVAWSPTTRLFRKISGLLDPRVGRGMFNTFHADHWFLRWPLDHLFHSRHFTLSFIKRLPSFGSDHFPVLVELVYDEPAGASQEGLVADAADEELGEEKIAEEAEKVLDAQRPS